MAHTVPAVGYLIQNRDKSVFYTGYTGPTKDTWGKIPNIQLDALIIEVSFPNKMSNIAKLTGHLSPELLIDEIKKLPHLPKRLFITYLKSVFKREIERELSEFKEIALEILNGGELIEI